MSSLIGNLFYFQGDSQLPYKIRNLALDSMRKRDGNAVLVENFFQTSGKVNFVNYSEILLLKSLPGHELW
jgi:hypothetical protein